MTSSTRRLRTQDLRLLKRLWPFARPDLLVLTLAMLAMPLIVFMGLVQPYLLKEAVDGHISTGKFEGLTSVLTFYLLAIFAGYVLNAFYAIALSWVGQRMLLRLRQFLYDRVLSLPLRFFDKRPAGMLLTRLTNDVDAIGESLGAGVITIIIDICMIVGAIVMMFSLEPTLTGLMLACSPLLLLVLEWIRRKLKVLFIEIRNAISAVNAFLAEQVDGVEILQLFSAEERSKAEFDVRNRRFRDAQRISNVYDSLMFAIVDGMGAVFIAFLLWYGSGLLHQAGAPIPPIEPLSAGLLIAFIDYLNRLLMPIRDLSSKIAVIQRAVAALDKIFSLVDAEEPKNQEGVSIAHSDSSITVKDCRFRYGPDLDYVLKGISFTVKPGESLAIVGASGSGKTTLTRLLDRSYEGYEGSITIGGIELSSIALNDLHERIAAVRQDIQLFSDTLQFNIDLGNPMISPEALEEATSYASANPIVQRLGWSYSLRERGADLSMGEGQLITFARTLAHGPEIIILDEATASVDSITEASIQEAIQKILKEKTVIVIAHRLSTIQQADRIVVLENGEIVESGNHHALMSKKGRYCELVSAGMALTH